MSWRWCNRSLCSLETSGELFDFSPENLLNYLAVCSRQHCFFLFFVLFLILSSFLFVVDVAGRTARRTRRRLQQGKRRWKMVALVWFQQDCQGLLVLMGEDVSWKMFFIECGDGRLVSGLSMSMQSMKLLTAECLGAVAGKMASLGQQQKNVVSLIALNWNEEGLWLFLFVLKVWDGPKMLTLYCAVEKKKATWQVSNQLIAYRHTWIC